MEKSQMETQLSNSPKEDLMSLPGDVPVRTFQSQDLEKAEPTKAEQDQASASTLSALSVKYSLDTSSSKTYPACLPLTRDEISPTSSWRFGTAGMLSRGVFWTRNLPEWTASSGLYRNAGGVFGSSVCALSDILESMSKRLLKYFLSVKALSGICRRAELRSKKLPTLLERAIDYMLGWWKQHPKLMTD
jgi:hypothetical protein